MFHLALYRSVPNSRGGRWGPAGGDTRSPGPDGATMSSPPIAVKVYDGYPLTGKRASQDETGTSRVEVADDEEL